jgi:hypothetical protein
MYIVLLYNKRITQDKHWVIRSSLDEAKSFAISYCFDSRWAYEIYKVDSKAL